MFIEENTKKGANAADAGFGDHYGYEYRWGGDFAVVPSSPFGSKADSNNGAFALREPS
jgi:hypothetical protein